MRGDGLDERKGERDEKEGGRGRKQEEEEGRMNR